MGGIISGRTRGIEAAVMLAVMVCAAGPASAELQEENVLLVYNSRRADSLAVANLYLAAHPDVVTFDLDSTAFGTASVSRTNYVTFIRNPIKNFINGTTTGNDLSQQIMVIVTTRGMPTQILGDFEFQLNATWSSVESDLTVLQQDLELAGSGTLQFFYSGSIDNPYHQRLNQPITNFSRSGVQVQRTFTRTNVVFGEAWSLSAFGPGDMYLVCRLDAIATDVGTPEEVTALEHIERLITRSQMLYVPRCGVQSLLDEYAGPDDLDDESAPPLFPGLPDFENTRTVLQSQSMLVQYNGNTNFVTGPELANQVLPLLVLGSYGENHDADGSSEDPPGTGTYISTYKFHPAAIFNAYESFNGNSIINGAQRGGQQQVLDFISAGGSFTVGHIREPAAFAVADMQFWVQNMLEHGMTFAEAVYSGIPCISWQHVPVGDPLAKIQIVEGGLFDRNLDDAFDLEDLYAFGAMPGDMNCDGTVNALDAEIIRNELRLFEVSDVAE